MAQEATQGVDEKMVYVDKDVLSTAAGSLDDAEQILWGLTDFIAQLNLRDDHRSFIYANLNLVMRAIETEVQALEEVAGFIPRDERVKPLAAIDTFFKR